MKAIIVEVVVNPTLTHRASVWAATRAALSSVSLLCTLPILVAIATMGLLLLSNAFWIGLTTAIS